MKPHMLRAWFLLACALVAYTVAVFGPEPGYGRAIIIFSAVVLHIAALRTAKGGEDRSGQ